MFDAVALSKPAAFHQPNRAELKAGREFEAVLLTNFVGQILPENMGNIDASHAGGDVWRSFMAQAVADQLAVQSKTGVGALIANQLMQVRQANGT